MNIIAEKIAGRLNIDLKSFVSRGFSFYYPDRAEVVLFDDADAMLWRIILEVDGVEFTYDIESLRPSRTAEQEIRGIYSENETKAYLNENIPPFPLCFDDTQGWRCKFRFVDGFSAPLIFDVVTITSPADLVYRMQYSADPDKYEKGLAVFEILLHTFKFM